MIIEFGNWQLRQMERDATNWELYHRHVASGGENAGVAKWNRMGRYYTFSTMDSALWFAADYDIRAADGTISFMEYYELLKETVDDFEKSILRCLEAVQNPAN